MARTAPLKIVIAYDDFADGVRAWELSERLASRFREDFEVDCDLWKFNALRGANAQARQASLDAVMEADMVMIAAGGQEALPVEVRKWIESWPPQQEDALAALVASVRPEAQISAHHSPLTAYLHQHAADVGMEFFCNEEHRAAILEPALPHHRFVQEQCEAASV